MAEIKYKKPVITRVPLDPEQAVLSQCKASGDHGKWLGIVGQYHGTCCWGHTGGGTRGCALYNRIADAHAVSVKEAFAGAHGS